MNKLALWIIGGLFFAGVVLALKYQIEVNAEQRVRIGQQAAALKGAEKMRLAAEDALLARDRDVAKITATNRRLQHDITKALQGDACAAVPIPPALDQLLRERAPGAGEGLPAGRAPAGAPLAALGG